MFVLNTSLVSSTVQTIFCANWLHLLWINWFTQRLIMIQDWPISPTSTFPDYFGGNRNHVTLMGHSAGAASAVMHVANQRTTSDLFHGWEGEGISWIWTIWIEKWKQTCFEFSLAFLAPHCWLSWTIRKCSISIELIIMLFETTKLLFRFSVQLDTDVRLRLVSLGSSALTQVKHS